MKGLLFTSYLWTNITYVSLLRFPHYKYLKKRLEGLRDHFLRRVEFRCRLPNRSILAPIVESLLQQNDMRTFKKDISDPALPENFSISINAESSIRLARGKIFLGGTSEKATVLRNPEREPLSVDVCRGCRERVLEELSRFLGSQECDLSSRSAFVFAEWNLPCFQKINMKVNEMIPKAMCE